MLLRHMNHRQSLPLLRALLRDPGSVDYDPVSQPFEGIAFHRTLYFVHKKTWFPIRDLEYNKFDISFSGGIPASVINLMRSFGEDPGLSNFSGEVRRPEPEIFKMLEKIGASPVVELKYRELAWAKVIIPDLPSGGQDSSVMIVRMGQDRREKVNDFPDYYLIRYLRYPYESGLLVGKPVFSMPGYSIPPVYDPVSKWVWDVIEYWPDSQRRYYTAAHMEPAAIGCLVNIRTGRRDYNSSAGDVKTLIAQAIEPSRSKHFARPTFNDILAGGSARTEKFGKFRVTTEEKILLTNDERWTRADIWARRSDPFYKPGWMRAEEEEVERIREKARLDREEEERVAARRRAADERARNMSEDDYPSTEIE